MNFNERSSQILDANFELFQFHAITENALKEPLVIQSKFNGSAEEQNYK